MPDGQALSIVTSAGVVDAATLPEEPLEDEAPDEPPDEDDAPPAPPLVDVVDEEHATMAATERKVTEPAMAKRM